jgi:cell division protein FtsQ
LQQVGTGSDIWRGASPSPPPRPVLRSPAAAATKSLHHRRARRRTVGRLIVLLLVLSAAIAVIASAKRAPSERPASVLAMIEHWAQVTGFGLDQVVLTGHRFTPDNDIFEALDLKRSRTMLTFDSPSAQSRIEELPWIVSASIERVFPDRLEVRVTERLPAAVWTRGPRSFLVDESGRTLAPVAADMMPALPRIAGEGADSAFAGLRSLLAQHSDFQARMVSAERIGNRRWTLRLAGGGAIHLPARGEANALAQAMQLLRNGVGHGEIDLRVAGRPILREGQRSAQVQLQGPEHAPSSRR